MPSPLFFADNLIENTRQLVLDEANSRHIVQVLRMLEGEILQVTNGRGLVAEATILRAHKKNCEVSLAGFVNVPATSHSNLCVAISPVKNNTRFEWFLEKATELGVHAIVPLICNRTEKVPARYDRMKGILISAMLQSQQSWMPELNDAHSFEKMLKEAGAFENKWIAHCLEGAEKQALTDWLNPYPAGKHLVLIGPEGDFTPAEIEQALANGFKPVTLGNTRLRTETAGVVAATLLQLLVK